MRTHENLEVWKRSVEVVVLVYKLTEQFPSEEKFGLTSQVRRAAVSIPSNIAEGAARSSEKEFLYFLSNSQGSCSVATTHLLIASKLGYISEEKYKAVRGEFNEIGKMLSGLRDHLLSKQK